jgi:levanase/fructan beta-fructosidase
MPACAGPDFYATQTFNNAEDADGRRVQLAWLRRGWYPNEFNYPPDMPFNQQMTFPCELTLKSYHGTMRLFRTPIRELAKLHTSERRLKPTTLAAGRALQLGDGELLHIETELAMSDASDAVIRLRGETIRLANAKIGIRDRDVSFFMPKDPAGRNAPIALTKLDILLDRTSIEVFANDGEVSLAAAFLPSGDELAIECTKGEIRLDSLVVHSMGSIWKR